MSAQRPKVMLADDAEPTRLLYRMHVESDGRFDVCPVEASNGREAVEMVEQCDPDILLLDLAMPVMDGLMAAKHIREFNQHVKIVVLTGQVSEQLEAACIEAGVNAYFRKGTDLDGVLDTLNALLAS